MFGKKWDNYIWNLNDKGGEIINYFALNDAAFLKRNIVFKVQVNLDNWNFGVICKMLLGLRDNLIPGCVFDISYVKSFAFLSEEGLCYM